MRSLNNWHFVIIKSVCSSVYPYELLESALYPPIALTALLAYEWFIERTQ